MDKLVTQSRGKQRKTKPDAARTWLPRYRFKSLAEPDEQLVRVNAAGLLRNPESRREEENMASSTEFDVRLVWAETRAGRGVKIAILDTGVDSDHPAFEESISATRSRDFTNSEVGYEDESGHGTLVAGVIAAKKKRDGVTGLAPEAELYIGKIIREQLPGGKVEDLAAGLEWAVEKGVHLINLSVGSRKNDRKVHQLIRQARSRGIFVICAAGNQGGKGIDYPAKLDECLAVGAIDDYDQYWEGDEDASAKGEELDLVADGDEVESTHLNGEYGKASGTSMAAPFVTGLVALAMAKRFAQGASASRSNLEYIRERLLTTATDLGRPGLDEKFGVGKIDPVRFIKSI
jgi:subtilisin family serine protease